MEKEPIERFLKTGEARKAVEKFLRNPYWEEAYRTAPTESSRTLMALMFCWSFAAIYDTERYAGGDVFGFDPGKLFQMANALEAEFTVEDWKHQLRYSGNTPRRTMIRNKIREFG